MHVHRACRVDSKCVKGCSYMSIATWKLARAFAWDGLCCAACGDAQVAAVALVNSSALHCFVSETLVTKLALPVLPGDSIEVILANVNQEEISKMWLVPLIVCSVH